MSGERPGHATGGAGVAQASFGHAVATGASSSYALFPSGTLAQVSRSPTVRLNTTLSGASLDHDKNNPGARTVPVRPHSASAKAGSTRASVITSREFGLRSATKSDALGSGRGKQLIVEPHLGSDGTCRRKPSAASPAPCARRAHCRRALPDRRCSAAPRLRRRRSSPRRGR